MDYKELIERLKRRESDMYINHPMTAQACREAASAITDLLARAEAAEAHCKRLDEYRENANEAAAKWEGMYYMADSRAEKAERERGAAVKYIRHYGWCAGCKYFRGVRGCAGPGLKNCTEQNDYYEFGQKEE